MGENDKKGRRECSLENKACKRYANASTDKTKDVVKDDVDALPSFVSFYVERLNDMRCRA